ncbi:MAG: PadR family transcriptional regulator [Erythrobacter sp.]|uniref:PadR family transcriptional regulator n=1 Tax=Erythrobacter sp. TaxID=1042 RepID=UPI0026214899|nr:PadR family transcriptional regulator [Erythrobacter sp.]MDJ0977237.1 PadR family transcriptional regulator [Erythrobacter sp.]
MRAVISTDPTPPLTPAVLHILLALAQEERHGYGIMKQVALDSAETVKMGPGTLYGALGRLTKSGLISESESRVDPALDDQRRIYYRITSAGSAVLAAELKRYRNVVSIGRKRQLSALPV